MASNDDSDPHLSKYIFYIPTYEQYLTLCWIFRAAYEYVSGSPKKQEGIFAEEQESEHKWNRYPFVKWIIGHNNG